MIIDFVIQVLVFLGIVALGSFMFFYGSEPAFTKEGKRPWYRRKFSRLWTTTPIGIILMGQKAAMFLLLSVILIRRYVGPFDWYDILIGSVYAVIVILFWSMLFVMRGIQRPVEKERINERYIK